MKSDAVLRRLLKLHPNKLIDLSLGRTQKLLAKLGNPQDRLPKTIHVAGTNGKGSTIAFMRAFLEAQGHRVHVYTSPQLVNFRERIRLAGTLVTDEKLLEALLHCERVNAGEPITYFEITTAAAFLLFAQVPADYLLLEVGLGGRFDATNVLSEKFGTVITPVSMDHEDFLGNNLGQIAGEKAGIMQEGAPCVIARQEPDAEARLEREAEELGIQLHRASEHFDGYAQGGRFIFQNEDGLLDLPPPALVGPFQYDNASVALGALKHFGVALDQSAIEKGLRQVQWPGRMMPIRAGELFDLLPKGSELWLDGGHNPAGGQVLADAIAGLNRTSPKPLTLIWGTFGNKDAGAYLEPLAAHKPNVIGVKVRSDRKSFSGSDLANVARGIGLDARPAMSIRKALESLQNVPAHRVFVCGSIHFIGHFLAQNVTELS